MGSLTVSAGGSRRKLGSPPRPRRFLLDEHAERRKAGSDQHEEKSNPNSYRSHWKQGRQVHRTSVSLAGVGRKDRRISCRKWNDKRKGAARCLFSSDSTLADYSQPDWMPLVLWRTFWTVPPPWQTALTPSSELAACFTDIGALQDSELSRGSGIPDEPLACSYAEPVRCALGIASGSSPRSPDT